MLGWSEAKRAMRRLVPRLAGRRLGEGTPDRGGRDTGGADLVQVSDDLPFFTIGHETLGAFPEDDSEAWVLG